MVSDAVVSVVVDPGVGVLRLVDQVAVKEDVLFGGLQNVLWVTGQPAQLVVEGSPHVAVIHPDELKNDYAVSSCDSSDSVGRASFQRSLPQRGATL